jgi:hypothetical protein
MPSTVQTDKRTTSPTLRTGSMAENGLETVIYRLKSGMVHRSHFGDRSNDLERLRRSDLSVGVSPTPTKIPVVSGLVDGVSTGAPPMTKPLLAAAKSQRCRLQRSFWN